MKKTLIANKPMRYAGRALKAGDSFQASGRDSRTLTLIGRASEFVPAPVAKEPVKVEPVAPSKVVEEETQKRTYKRRDLRAEQD